MNWIIRNIIICSVLAIGVFYFLFYSESGSYPIFTDSWVLLLLVVILANIGGATFYYSIKLLNDYTPWHKNRSLRFFAETISGLIIFLFLGWLLFNFYSKMQFSPEDFSSFWEDYWDGALKYTILVLVFVYIAFLINFSIFSYNQYAEGQIETYRLERNQKQLQFEALKSQLSPHFLFNSLNTISSLMYKDTRVSEMFIRKLAGNYQYILKTDGKKLVTMVEELKMVEDYFYMQKIKYGACIRLEQRLSPNLFNTYIPPLTLQMLAENALKHNRICNEETLILEIYDDGKSIIIRNNISKKSELLKIGNNLVDRPKEDTSHKIGLKNIRKRYLYFINKNIDLHIDDYFTVKLPIIEQAIEG